MLIFSQTCLALIFFMNMLNSYFCDQVCYDRYSLFRITPTTQSQLKSLLNLHAMHVDELQFWLRTSAVNHSADVMVKPTVRNVLVKQLASLRLPYKVIINDIGKKIKENIVTPEERQSLGFFEVYRSFAEIDQYIQDLVYKYPDCLSLIPIGKSFEGRPLQLLRISSYSFQEKHAVWIQGGSHAREWIGPATVTFIATKLAEMCYKQNGEINDYNFDYYILPILNPDGYEYSQNIDRLWRKTRSRYPNPEDCAGVDASRNWDIKWSVSPGASSRPCSHYYAGPAAFSEPETRAVSEFMLYNLKGRLLLFLDFHSYAQRWLTPYGYTSKLPPNYREQKRLAEVATRAIELVNGTKYTSGTGDNTMYTVTGDAKDWVYDVMLARYVYDVKLRDKGRHGFILPRCFILPTAMETWEGVKAMELDLAKKFCRDRDAM